MLPEATLSLNVLRKLHKQAYKRLRDRYQWLMLAQTLNRHTGPVKLTLTRLSTGTLDYDNLAGGAKPLIDALVNGGILSGDTPALIPQRDYQQEKIKRGQRPQTIIQIEAL